VIPSSSLSRETVVAWTQRFVRFPSELTPALEAGSAVQSFIKDCVWPLIDESHLPGRLDSMGNLIIEVGPTGLQPAVAIVAYAMTHPRAGMEAAFNGELIGSATGPSIRGRGVSEQKAAMGASLAAFADVARLGDIKRPLVWILLTAGETGRHDAIATALSTLPIVPRRAVLAVGTNGKILIGHRGRLDVELVIRGRPSHSSTPWLGVNAIDGVRDVLIRVAARSRELAKHAQLGPASLVCTKIETGPDATHTVQGWARMVLDRRLLPAESPDRVFDELSAALKLDPPLEVELLRGAFMHGHAIDTGAEILQSIAGALRAAGRPVPSIEYSSGALDAGYLQNLGVEAIMWGPGDPVQFHTDEESVLIAELLDMAESYRAALTQFAFE
jgi:acetylornithine deacetylase/succinyl-diaminopimelate desuccinylase-like protein